MGLVTLCKFIPNWLPLLSESVVSPMSWGLFHVSCLHGQVLDGKEDLEKQHRDSIKQLNSVVERQEKDLAKLQAEVEELEERNRSVQAALDSAYK